MGTVDCALTFEELYPLFESRGIDPEQLEETPLDEASGFGRSFAHSGGVAAAVAQGLKEKKIPEEKFQLRAVSCSGLAACKTELLKLRAALKTGNPEAVNFIEGMACEGGCVQGPGILIRSPKNQQDVEKHAQQAEGRTIAAAVAGEEEKPRKAKKTPAASASK